MKTNQSDTAINHFDQPATQRMLRNHEEIVFAILDSARSDMTLKEIASRFNEWTGYAVPHSSLCAPLSMLKAKGAITDAGAKRPCRINSIRKKVWAVAAAGTIRNAADDLSKTDAFVADSALSE
jgi:transposase